MGLTRTPATLLEVLRWGHLAASPSCILIAWYASNFTVCKFIYLVSTLHIFHTESLDNMYIKLQSEASRFQLTEKPFHCSANNTMTPKLYEQCFSTDVDWFSWCYTRTYLNDSGTTHQWGHCEPSCRNEGLLMKKTHRNLASNLHSQLWSEHIFNLDTFSNGHCHTYDPANSSFAGRRGQFYAMLGK